MGLKKIKINFYINIVLIFLAAISLRAQVLDARVKAAMICRFADFIFWPDSENNSGTKKDSLLIITVLGRSPVEPFLQQIASLPVSGKKRVVVRKIENPDEIGESQILFINTNQKGKIKKILRRIKGRNILTVADTPGFAEKGIMINFYSDSDRIRFEINQKAVKKSRLDLSSRLLQIARIVGDK